MEFEMSFKRTTVVFEKPGRNTQRRHLNSSGGCKERKIETILVSTSTGKTGLKA
jgi:hypothetical protein